MTGVMELYKPKYQEEYDREMDREYARAAAREAMEAEKGRKNKEKASRQAVIQVGVLGVCRLIAYLKLRGFFR